MIRLITARRLVDQLELRAVSSLAAGTSPTTGQVTNPEATDPPEKPATDS